MNSYQVEAQNKLTGALNDVFSALNVLGRNNSELVKDFFSRQHRTLQQQFVSVVIIPILLQLDEAHKSGRVDGRNQAAAKLAHDLLSNVDEGDLWLPLI